ncbi:TPA: hypothetical protein ACOTHO_002774 [Clostridium perfringens]|uniref:Uncharacterized protein n=1 Tax=Clostridium perfringens TaxID=1502 RepID=A0AAN5SFH6_CLOPF|nr:hypothetical protein [Clostridium perfringens]AQW26801.1 hypothetical protein BXT94_08485 [Clostridium perfringens]KAB8120564.1 hypothetical protein FVB38_05705 [Clostridium perfringens]KQC91091.1 hypothetical protein AM596_16620 [Clostridium perfringens CP4]MBO3435677.1 hypothetical protein [Clostridium perfringens]MDK0593127.1 hypothetical protein [Clostridium perfringens]
MENINERKDSLEMLKDMLPISGVTGYQLVKSLLKYKDVDKTMRENNLDEAFRIYVELLLRTIENISPVVDKENKIDNTQLAISYIKDVLIESDDKLLFIYWDEMGFDLNEVRVERIVNNLERKGYSCRISSKGIFVERYDYIKKELSDMLDLNSKDIIKGCRVEYYKGNNIYGNIYYNEETEDSYSVHIYNNFEDYLDDVLGLVEGNWVISRELDNDFYMIVLKNVPNIDMECDEE